MIAYDSVKYWARLPGKDYMSVADNGFLYWFFPWTKRNLADRLFILIVFIPFVCGTVIWAINMIFWTKKNKKYYWLFLANILNLLYWFFTAPDVKVWCYFFCDFSVFRVGIFGVGDKQQLFSFFQKNDKV